MKRDKSIIGYFLTVVFLFISFNTLLCQKALFNNVLDYGRFNVGLKVEMLQDYSRSFFNPEEIQSKTDKMNDRAVRMYMWYPSVDKIASDRITFEQYIEIAQKDFTSENNSSQYSFKIPLLRVKDKNISTESLRFKTRAYENPEPAGGKFPLIIFGQGLYYENPINHFALCEYFASHGFVVVTCPLKGANNNIIQLTETDLESAIRDLEFLLSAAERLHFIDQTKIGLAGFDMGGMAVQVMQMRNTNIKAILTLDAGIIFEHFTGLPKTSKSFNLNNLTIPWMHITEARFLNPYRKYLKSSLWEKAKYSDRYFILIDEIEHANFTSHSLFNISEPLMNYWSKGSFPQVAAYKAICGYSLNFFDAVLNRNNQSESYINKEIPYDSNTVKPVTLERIKAQHRAPSIDELLYSIQTGKLDVTINKIIQYKTDYPEWEKLNENQLNLLGYRFLAAGDLTRAKDILKLNAALFDKSFNAFDSLGEIYLLLGDKENAKINYKKSIELNPSNKNAADVLKKILNN